MSSRINDPEDRLAAVEAAGDARIPHAAALAIMEGTSPVRAFRDHRGLTLRDLAERADISPSYLSEIEHGRKPGAVAVLTRVADALGTSIDALVMD
ncbi:MAG: helix-turn-helix transcriptional regulator [Chloroflexi bacterium]|nr:helix-turn-helix transcriptional regulator [Chloroflexota bacterium]MYE32546.1 helix-turn-helix transcriptional regulator [Chloroflexota bacterium]